MMSQKHYQMVADVLSEEYDRAQTADQMETVANIAQNLSREFKRDNPNFKPDRFFKAVWKLRKQNSLRH